MRIEITNVPGDRAVEELFRLREERLKSGAYPFMIGDAWHLETEVDNGAFDRTIQDSLGIDGRTWLENRRSLYGEYWVDPNYVGPPQTIPIRERRLSVLEKYASRQTRELVPIGLVSIDEAWKLPAATQFFTRGCSLEELIAVMRYWQEEYAAEIIAVKHDTVECYVQRPPTNVNKARRLAMEHLWFQGYTPDTDDDASCTALAFDLLNSDYWHFWWD